MTELLQSQQKDYLQASTTEPEPHGGRYDLRRYPAIIGSAVVLSVVGAFMGGHYLDNKYGSSPRSPAATDSRSPAATRIVAGVQSLVLSHRSAKQCQETTNQTSEVLFCSGVAGFQLDIEQCRVDVKNAAHRKESYSFNPRDLLEISQGCYDGWVTVSPELYKVENGKIITFPGKPGEHLTS